MQFANAAGMLASRFSLNPTVGQIYGLLYMSNGPVSLSEMVKKLGISKGSASTNVRILESWGAVRKVWVDNSRKDYYEANPDTLNIIINRVREGVGKRLDEAEEKLKNVEKGLASSAAAAEDNAGFYESRINKIKESYGQIKDLLQFFSRED
ncbi:MAG: hypothetical protein JXJ19_03345 [Elusimicrobia bacterium]|nr:hypothetical protein [Elusimicrobiota bacterium]